jgi:hypothetical protein
MRLVGGEWVHQAGSEKTEKPAPAAIVQPAAQKFLPMPGSYLLVQTPTGPLIAEAPEGIDLDAIPESGELPITEQKKLQDLLYPSEKNNKGCCRIRVRVRVVVRQNTTVRGTSVTVERPEVRADLPAVTVEGVKLPEVTIGSPTQPRTVTVEEALNLTEECRLTGSDPSIFIVNRRSTAMAVVVNVGGMELSETIIPAGGEMPVGVWRNKTCAEVDPYVAIWSARVA